MNSKTFAAELFLYSTAIGLVATFAAPWVELRGTYAAWRIVEWHAFWRGEGAFQLASVVAANYRVPIEFATIDMPAMLRNLFALGGALGAWHGIALIALLVAGARLRLRDGAPPRRVALEIVAIIVGGVIALYLLAMLLALPSSLTPKVDFRGATDLHTDSLIWSGVTILPIAPALSVIAAIGQIAALWSLALTKRA